MKHLTEKQMQILVLDDQGLSIPDIADTLGVSTSSVRLQIERVREKVKRGYFTPALLPIEAVASGSVPYRLPSNQPQKPL